MYHEIRCDYPVMQALDASPALTLTEKMFLDIEKRNKEGQAGGAGGSTTIEGAPICHAFQFLHMPVVPAEIVCTQQQHLLALKTNTSSGLRRTDCIWEKVKRHDTQSIPTFVTEISSALPKQPEFDVTICGGTLGIFLATALQLKGLRVCVLERGKLAGRAQEWNISRHELDALLQLRVLTAEEVEAAIAVEFNPVRMQFKVSCFASNSKIPPTPVCSGVCVSCMAPCPCLLQRPDKPLQLQLQEWSRGIRGGN
jgi:hypothetical protein